MSNGLSVMKLGDGKLSPWPWNPGDVVETQGMKPLGKKDFESNGIVAGKWACNAGKVAMNGHPVNEACFVVSGSVTITDEQGHTQTFRAGEAFLIPCGFRGLWSNSDEFAKIFVAAELGMGSGRILSPAGGAGSCSTASGRRFVSNFFIDRFGCLRPHRAVALRPKF